MRTVDVAIVGGGIAGMSAAAAIALALPDERVGVFEAEAGLTHHTTGRSAAVFIENYGALSLRPLTLASKAYYHRHDFLTPRGYLAVAGPSDEGLIDQLVLEGRAMNPNIAAIDAEEAQRLAPLMRPDHVVAAVYEPDASAIDVAGLHQSFVRGFRAAGGTIETLRRITAGRPVRSDGASGWVLETTSGPISCGTVVNAAGAWGDVVASSAGVAPVGLRPLRRTAFMVTSPYPESGSWPLIADVAHAWYANPDGHQFLCSLADETPSEPCDAKPEEVDIALAIERINSATTLDIRSVNSSWAGLRTFSPDRGMVIGPDPEHPSFIWCVGQGGTGIQTAPGAGQLVADLLVTGEPGSTFEGTGLDLSLILPGRLR
ncbi:MAG: FAD-binding oxidoreductase [Actinomycetota bacterium]|nr:FAD-binding oxidoreductase [Actinomycetota bacterium]